MEDSLENPFSGQFFAIFAPVRELFFHLVFYSSPFHGAGRFPFSIPCRPRPGSQNECQITHLL